MFVDARHEFDFKLGHIKGAINVPLKDYDLRKSVLNGTSPDRVIIAYCDGAECNSSIELSVKLMKDGHPTVKIFFGGWKEWEAANLPVEKTP
jgi:3-mercaptopyruvate sulfurtransferase SseA